MNVNQVFIDIAEIYYQTARFKVGLQLNRGDS